ncbi:hypothetical protein HYALB_00005902 [Hymenoscyphus albidus]|uniref:CorA-like transporter domain-containing protein n=1 Tax=Hymenoscyphus albidus TaxID=595503 RepID=A0A9N9Q8W5_9HELO|nr:hypothetical protein HYALB_00005902 [Hymenoscyphus albidus]
MDSKYNNVVGLEDMKGCMPPPWDSPDMTASERECKNTFSLSEKIDLQVIRGREGHLMSRENVFDLGDLDRVYRSDDTFQIFYIGRKNSHTRLKISRTFFRQILLTYNVFDRIWDFMLPFGFRTRDSDIEHAPIRFHQSMPVLLRPKKKLGDFECAYNIQYVELNHRNIGATNNPGYDQWSIRQTAVYQQYNHALDK